jgi:hypothetical protein
LGRGLSARTDVDAWSNWREKMVEISMIIEGGVLPGSADAITMDNSQALRQSLHRIFKDVLGIEVSIKIQLGGGYRAAACQFAASSEKNSCLYVDLDSKRECISNWFDKLVTENPDKPIHIPDDKRQNIFFMIQEMEAWILNQPSSIEVWGKNNNYIRTHREPIEGHSLIAGKNIEDINKPSKALGEIIKHFFNKECNGKLKKVQYGKLKSAPGLLDCLNTTELKENDAELQRFCKNYS